MKNNLGVATEPITDRDEEIQQMAMELIRSIDGMITGHVGNLSSPTELAYYLRHIQLRMDIIASMRFSVNDKSGG